MEEEEVVPEEQVGVGTVGSPQAGEKRKKVYLMHYSLLGVRLILTTACIFQCFQCIDQVNACSTSFTSGNSSELLEPTYNLPN